MGSIWGFLNTWLLGNLAKYLQKIKYSLVFRYKCFLEVNEVIGGGTLERTIGVSAGDNLNPQSEQTYSGDKRECQYKTEITDIRMHFTSPQPLKYAYPANKQIWGHLAPRQMRSGST
ncbi:MAG: hypothetical protein ABIH23_07075 [bacterium]